MAARSKGRILSFASSPMCIPKKMSREDHVLESYTRWSINLWPLSPSKHIFFVEIAEEMHYVDLVESCRLRGMPSGSSYPFSPACLLIFTGKVLDKLSDKSFVL